MSKIEFQLATNNDKFKKGLADAQKEAEKSSQSIGNKLGDISTKAATAGVAILAIGKALFELGKAGYSEATSLADISGNLQVSTDSLQAFDSVGKKNGVTMEQLTKALEAVSLKSQDLLDGNEQVTASFSKLGLKTKDFIGLGTDERLVLIAKAFSSAKDRGEAFSAVSDILGAKIGPKLAATLDEIGSKGLKNLIDGAKEAGQVIDEDVIKRLDKFDDRLARWGKWWKTFAADATDAVIGLANFALHPWTAEDDLINSDIADRQREEKAKKDQKAADAARAKATAQAAKDKAAQKRDIEEKKKLDEYIKAKGANDKEAEQQAFDSLSAEEKKNQAIKERIELEKQLVRLPRNQIDAETKREELRKRILELTKRERDANKDITAEKEKQEKALKDINDKLAESAKKTASAKTDVINAQFDPFRFSLGEAATGKRGSGRAKKNASLINSKEDQARAILDRNNLQFGEDGSLQYIPAPGESKEAIASKNKIAQTQTLPRLQKLMGGAAGLRAATANLDRKDQDPTAQAKKAYKEALDESKTLQGIKTTLEGKFLNQGGGK